MANFWQKLIPESHDVFFKGRELDPRIGEWVKMPDQLDLRSRKIKIGILGFPDDTGVHLNKGRKGAKQGPHAIRKQLFKMTTGMQFDLREHIDLYDFGNIRVHKNIMDTHQEAQDAVHAIVGLGVLPILLGGGHDFAAPSFIGFSRAMSEKHRKIKLGLFNVDPHLDVREWEKEMPHSGTPFRTLLENKFLKGTHFTQFGTCENRNSKNHFEFCLQHKVKIFEMNELRNHKQSIHSLFKRALSQLSEKVDRVALTIDMDSCKDGAGVSAPTVMGFSSAELCQMAALYGLNVKKMGYLEIAEVSPQLEASDSSAKIAAEILFAFLNSTRS